MIWFIDRWLKKILSKRLHQKRDAHIQKAIQKYQASHPDADDETLAALREKLESEITRVFAVADESIIATGLIRARITFWVSAVFSTIIVLALAQFPITTSLVPFFVPLMAAFVGWLTAIVTIPFSYTARVNGAMKSGSHLFEIEQETLREKQAAELASVNIPPPLEPLEPIEPQTQPQLSLNALTVTRRTTIPLIYRDMTRFGIWQPYSTAAMSLNRKPDDDPFTLKQKP